MCDPEKAKENGVDLKSVNTGNLENPVEYLKQISDGGFDDVFVMAPVLKVSPRQKANLNRKGLDWLFWSE